MFSGHFAGQLSDHMPDPISRPAGPALRETPSCLREGGGRPGIPQAERCDPRWPGFPGRRCPQAGWTRDKSSPLTGAHFSTPRTATLDESGVPGLRARSEATAPHPGVSAGATLPTPVSDPAHWAQAAKPVARLGAGHSPRASPSRPVIEVRPWGNAAVWTPPNPPASHAGANGTRGLAVHAGGTCPARGLQPARGRG